MKASQNSPPSVRIFVLVGCSKVNVFAAVRTQLVSLFNLSSQNVVKHQLLCICSAEIPSVFTALVKSSRLFCVSKLNFTSYIQMSLHFVTANRSVLSLATRIKCRVFSANHVEFIVMWLNRTKSHFTWI